jgi:hypothetical protein
MPTLRQYSLTIPCLLALAGTGTLMANEMPPGDPAVQLGTGILDDQCKNVSFAPLPAPVAFPGGTSQIAYRVEAPRGRNVDGVTGKVTIACAVGAVNQRRCAKWDVVGGEALLTSFTVTVSCGAPGEPSSPFKAGSYKLELSKGDVVVETLDFTVAK